MVAHRIRAAVATPLEIEGELVELAVDLGIAIEEDPSEADVSALLRAADRAMYQAKAAASRRKMSS
jgi:GGDEF domain-containing protein